MFWGTEKKKVKTLNSEDAKEIANKLAENPHWLAAMAVEAAGHVAKEYPKELRELVIEATDYTAQRWSEEATQVFENKMKELLSAPGVAKRLDSVEFNQAEFQKKMAAQMQEFLRILNSMKAEEQSGQKQENPVISGILQRLDRLEARAGIGQPQQRPTS